MAKGRKLTSSRSERFLGSYGFAGSHHGPTDDAAGGVELGEEDVWSMVDDMVREDWNPRAAVESRRHRTFVDGFEDPPPGKVASSPRVVHQLATPRARARHVATSAPVNVPDWSKIYRVDSVESMHDSDEMDDDFDSDMVPPHEYLARAYGQSRNVNSVFVGVGRTLKGRDMSRVRDAVWSRTGFNG